MNNLDIYTQVAEVPKDAQKEIKGGRIGGMTDINPMWRIKKLTEVFGACGTGWYYDIVDKKLENGADGEIAAFVDIKLYYKLDTGEWSAPVMGTGGNMFVAKESRGLHVSDECFKMALTDAISVAAKALGVGAKIYWNKDTTKYDTPTEEKPKEYKCEECGKEFTKYEAPNGRTYTPGNMFEMSKKKNGKALCLACSNKLKAENEKKEGTNNAE